MSAVHSQEPRVINVDKNAAYAKAIDELKEKKDLSEQVVLRQNKYLNNIIEQDHRFIKRLVNPGMGFVTVNTARRTLRGYETMNMKRIRTSFLVSKKAMSERKQNTRAQIFGVAG